MRSTVVLCAVLCGFVLAGVVSAEVPGVMSYQGVLKDPTGACVPDGNYDLSFRLYDTATAGTPVWSEGQTVSTVDGIFNVILGSVTPMGLGFSEQLWLEIAVGTGGALYPRTKLTTSPYAFRAAVAESLVGGAVADADWLYSGDDIYRLDGDVGVGTSSPAAKLHVDVGAETAGRFESSGIGSTMTLDVENTAGNAARFTVGLPATSYPGSPTAVYGLAGGAGNGGHFSATGTGMGLLAFSSGAASALYAGANGSGYSGYFTGGSGVRVDGQCYINTFRMDTGASADRVLTSDGLGHGTWQPPSAVSDGDWDVWLDDLSAAVDGNVGIGTAIPEAKLDIDIGAASTVEGFRLRHFGSPTRLVNLERAAAPSSANDIVQIKVPSNAPDDAQFIECERGTSPVFQVMTDGSIFADGGGTFDDAVDITGALTVDNYGLRTGDFASGYTSNNVHVVHAEVTGTGTGDAIAVCGLSAPSDNYGIGGYFAGGYRGVVGSVAQTGGGNIRGVYGLASGGTGNNYAVYATATGGNTCYGIYSSASAGASASYAGYFQGNVSINGTLSKSAGSFKIDHPLDPANKYLSHSFVESPDMMNVYNGNVVMDGAGEAWVELPEWFEVLNRDFRYQLTALDAPGPNLHVAERIAGNRFMIAGGKPGMEVSWQVTGVRQDKYARAHPIVVEEAKLAHDVGSYLHPELYGLPETARVGYVEEREVVIEPSAREPKPERVWDPTDGE